MMTQFQQSNYSAYHIPTVTQMLAIFLAPNGNVMAEHNYLQDKALEWVEFIKCGHLSKSRNVGDTLHNHMENNKLPFSCNYFYRR